MGAYKYETVFVLKKTQHISLSRRRGTCGRPNRLVQQHFRYTVGMFTRRELW